MKTPFVLLFSFLFPLALTVPAFGGSNQESAKDSSCVSQRSASVFLTELGLQRPNPTDCYLECKVTSGGDSGDSFTRCYNECMSRR